MTKTDTGVQNPKVRILFDRVSHKHDGPQIISPEESIRIRSLPPTDRERALTGNIEYQNLFQMSIGDEKVRGRFYSLSSLDAGVTEEAERFAKIMKERGLSGYDLIVSGSGRGWLECDHRYHGAELEPETAEKFRQTLNSRLAK